MISGLPRKADTIVQDRQVRLVPILLQKGVEGWRPT
jgi:hypothetical protein